MSDEATRRIARKTVMELGWPKIICGIFCAFSFVGLVIWGVFIWKEYVSQGLSWSIAARGCGSMVFAYKFYCEAVRLWTGDDVVGAGTGANLPLLPPPQEDE